MVHVYDTVESITHAIDGALTNGGLSDKARAQVVDDSIRVTPAREVLPILEHEYEAVRHVFQAAAA
jgi:hypothetical protein